MGIFNVDIMLEELISLIEGKSITIIEETEECEFITIGGDRLGISDIKADLIKSIIAMDDNIAILTEDILSRYGNDEYYDYEILTDER